MNRERGESQVEINGKPYRLRLSLNNLCAMEAMVSAEEGRRVTAKEIFARWKDGDVRSQLAVLWAAFRESDKTLTSDQVGELVEAGGGPSAVFLKMFGVTESLQADERDLKELVGEADARPH